jgi:hypothetical protein
MELAGFQIRIPRWDGFGIGGYGLQWSQQTVIELATDKSSHFAGSESPQRNLQHGQWRGRRKEYYELDVKSEGYSRTLQRRIISENLKKSSR